MKLCALFLLSTLSSACRQCPYEPDPRCPGYNGLNLPGVTPPNGGVRRALRSNHVQEEQKDLPLDESRLLTDRELQSASPKFNLKLHWEEGVCWQEEWIERKYCLQCEGLSCEEGKQLYLQYCWITELQEFVWINVAGNPAGGGSLGQLKVASKNLCLHKNGPNEYILRTCSTNERQVFIRSSLMDVFELHPRNDLSKCLNQHHDPYPEEDIRLTSCEIARRVHTSKWEIYTDPPDEPLVPSMATYYTSTDPPTAALAADQLADRTFFCFPGDATVRVLDKGTVLMKNVKIGDQVQVQGGTFSPIYAFGHFDPDVEVAYLSIQTTITTLVVSELHMVFVAGKGFVAASSVVVGDLLEVTNHKMPVPVTSIRTRLDTGAYAPFTIDGTVMVNDILASSYVSIRPGLIALHAMAHLFCAPRRLVCTIAGCEHVYNDHGVATWLARPLHQTQTNVFLLLPSLLLGLLATLLELLLSSSSWVAFLSVLLVSSISFPTMKYFRWSIHVSEKKHGA